MTRSKQQHTARANLVRMGMLFSALLAVPMALSGCTTAKRAAHLVVDHHVGMAQGAADIMSGEAEAREQRLAKLRADLEASQSALALEQDQGRLVELLKQHVALQDALVAEILPVHGGHGHQCGGHQQGHAESQSETTNEQQESHQH